MSRVGAEACRYMCQPVSAARRRGSRWAVFTNVESAVAPVEVEDTAALETGPEVVLAVHSAAASVTTTTTTTTLIPLVHSGNAHGIHTLGKCVGDCDEDAGVCPPTLASLCVACSLPCVHGCF